MVSWVPGSPIDWAAMMPTAAAGLNQRIGSQVASIALAADAPVGKTAQHRAHAHHFDARVDDFVHHVVGKLVARHYPVETRNGVEQDAALQAVADIRQHHFFAVLLGDEHTLGSAAVFLGDDDILRYVDQAAGQVARFCSTQGGIGQAFARAVTTDKVFQHAQAFAEVAANRHVDDSSRWAGHQPAHTGKLADLLELGFGRARPGDGEDRAIRIKRGFHHLGDVFGSVVPGIDCLLVLLVLGNQTVTILLFQFGNLGSRPCQVRLAYLRALSHH